jgi:hypothetical protein
MSDPQIVRIRNRLIQSSQTPRDVRATAIRYAGKMKDHATLLALCNVVEDLEPAYKLEDEAMLRPDYAFADRTTVKAAQKYLQHQYANTSKVMRIGDLAEAKLKAATGRNFGLHADPWREFVNQRIQ